MGKDSFGEAADYLSGAWEAFFSAGFGEIYR
jgi:hypothetical protein